MTWGYDAEIIRKSSGKSGQQNISQHGNNLLVSLQQERKANPDRPLIFIAHSFGGIVLKVALDNSRRSQHQPQYLNVYSSTKGIVFLGTPHGGARALRGLSPNSELLENLRKVFLQMLEDDQFGIHSFYETKSKSGILGLDGLVVPYDSALVGHARKEISVGLHGNHEQICKFQGPDDANYKAVFGALQDYLIGATQPRST
ncbi:hypothetical protein N3K66_005738 [Trichothecium roseum]|uniref:Uncharacterized protein n=1 Tax=Trichothecium roseum TaxID=47278 RepID=A0ACC0V0D2_9HYPO|nr:hypothetical protein N3K66_005738 [Trichothecium roseum]